MAARTGTYGSFGSHMSSVGSARASSSARERGHAVEPRAHVAERYH